MEWLRRLGWLRSKRARAAVGAGVGLAGAVLAAIVVSRSLGPDAQAVVKSGSVETFTVKAPALGIPLTSASGRPLTAWESTAALVAVPNRMPVWARTAVTRLLGSASWSSAAPHLWMLAPDSERQVASWALPGSDLVSLPTLVPVPGMSLVELRSIEHTLHLSATRLSARLEGARLTVATVPVPSGVPAARTSIHLRWQNALAAALPVDGAAAMVAQDGRVLALAGSRQNSSGAFHAAPVGLTLMPLVLAQAATHTGMFAHLQAAAGLSNLTRIGSIWGAGNVLAAFRHLGVENRPVPGAQVVPLPSLKAVTGSRLLATGQGVWTTPLAVARAYLALASSGTIPALTYESSASVGKASHGAALSGANLASLQMVEKLLPEVQAGGVTFRVWDPAPYHYDVALTRLADGSTLVLAVDGLSSQGQFQSLLATVGRLVGQGVTPHRANLSSR